MDLKCKTFTLQVHPRLIKFTCKKLSLRIRPAEVVVIVTAIVGLIKQLCK